MMRSTSPSLIVGARIVVLSVSIVGCSAASNASGEPAVTTAAPSATPAPSSAAVSNDLVADIDIGEGRTMHLLCVGPVASGKPTVIFESGLGGDAGQWSDVLHALDPTVRACAYDRAGDGQSPALGTPDGRTTADQVDDLHALLSAAEIPPPYVLVGYSIGGWNLLVHADKHPDDILGAVMVEVRPPAASRRWAAAMPPEASGEPEAVTLTRTDPETFEQDPNGNPEGLLLDASASEVLATKGLGDRPLVVLAGTDTAIISEGFDEVLAAKVLDIWWELQDELAAASTNGSLRKIEGANHELPFTHPDEVAAAISEVLGN